jgi:hypothetical protein
METGNTWRNKQKMVPWHGFDTGSVNVEKLVDGHVFLLVLWLSPISNIPPLPHNHLFIHRRRNIISAVNNTVKFFSNRATVLGPGPPHYRSFTITLIHTTLGRTPLDKWSARRRDLFLTIHNTHNRQTSMPSGGIRTHSPNKRTAADPRLRQRGHWDRHT